MNADQLQAFRAVLQARKGELVHDLKSRIGGLETERAADRIDEVRSMTDRSETAGDVACMSKLLSQIEEACRRMDEGVYGMCQACGGELPRKRLEILPWARYCVTCQQIADRAQRDIADAPVFPEALAS